MGFDGTDESDKARSGQRVNVQGRALLLLVTPRNSRPSQGCLGLDRRSGMRPACGRERVIGWWSEGQLELERLSGCLSVTKSRVGLHEHS